MKAVKMLEWIRTITTEIIASLQAIKTIPIRLETKLIARTGHTKRLNMVSANSRESWSRIGVSLKEKSKVGQKVEARNSAKLKHLLRSINCKLNDQVCHLCPAR